MSSLSCHQLGHINSFLFSCILCSSVGIAERELPHNVLTLLWLDFLFGPAWSEWVLVLEDTCAVGEIIGKNLNTNQIAGVPSLLWWELETGFQFSARTANRPCVVAHVFHPSTWEVDLGVFLWVQCQPAGVHSEVVASLDYIVKSCLK